MPRHIDPVRVTITADSGLKQLPRPATRQELRALAAGTQFVRRELGMSFRAVAESGPMRATVRGAGSRDLDVLLPLVEQFQEFERIPFDGAAARHHLAHLLDESRLGQVLLAEVDGRAIGYAILTYGYDLEFGGMDAYLTDLFLVETERDRGLGTWLLGQVEEAAAAAGVKALHLMVAPSNHRAHHVYYRAGFRASPRLFLTKILDE